MKHKQSVNIRNRTRKALIVRTEPWAEEVTIQPGESVDLHIEGPSGQIMEVAVEPEAIAVYGWAGSDVDIGEVRRLGASE